MTFAVCLAIPLFTVFILEYEPSLFVLRRNLNSYQPAFLWIARIVC